MAIVRLQDGRIRAVRVLLLEESPDDCELAAHELRRDGFAVMTAHTALEALESARLARPDIILANMSPEGLVFAAACKELPQLASVPIIGITGHLDGLYSDELTALSGGFQKLLRKPLTLAVFRDAIARLFS